jgi:hypothetical protein
VQTRYNKPTPTKRSERKEFQFDDHQMTKQAERQAFYRRSLKSKKPVEKEAEVAAKAKNSAYNAQAQSQEASFHRNCSNCSITSTPCFHATTSCFTYHTIVNITAMMDTQDHTTLLHCSLTILLLIMLYDALWFGLTWWYKYL